MSNLTDSALSAALLLIEAGMLAKEATALSSLTSAPSLPAAAALSPSDPLPVRQTASLSVTIDGSPLGADDLDAVAEVSIKQDIEAPSSFSLRFTGDDGLARADMGKYDLGGMVTVSLGYTTPTPVIMGEITGLELDVSSSEVPSLIVRGYDLRHRLLRGTRTDSYPLATDSAIATRIAQRNGLTFGGEVTTIAYELVLQHEQTDLEFLKQRAARIGYEVVVEDMVLYFRPHRLGTSGSVTLSLSDDITELYARMTALGQPKEVHVRGWDPKHKQFIDAVAAASDLTHMGGTSGADAAAAAYKLPTLAGTVNRVDQPVLSAAEAKAMAEGQLGEMALGFITGEGTCLGNPDIKAGIMLELTKLGNRFGGTYYVASAEHTYTRREGYRTKFTLQRNATQTSRVAASVPEAPPL